MIGLFLAALVTLAVEQILMGTFGLSIGQAWLAIGAAYVAWTAVLIFFFYGFSGKAPAPAFIIPLATCAIALVLRFILIPGVSYIWTALA